MRVCAPICLNKRKLNTLCIIQSMAMYIYGGTHAYYEHKLITIIHTILIRNNVYNVLRASLNIIKQNHVQQDSVFEVVEENLIPCVNQAVLFGHKLSHLKFEIHVHLSHRRLQTRCQNINLSDLNVLMALKGDGSRHSHWLIARYPQTTHTGNQATSDQPFLDLRRAQVIFRAGKLSTSPQNRQQSYLELLTCVSDR